VVAVEGQYLVVFDVPSADGPVQVTGDGFPLRIGDQTIEATESQIRALKFQGLVESFESRPSSLALTDLNRDLLAKARQGAGLMALSDAEYLLKRKLADRRGSGLVLRQAAELLFAQQGPEHPNASTLVRVISARGRRGSALPAPDPHPGPGQGGLVGRCDRAPGAGVHGDRRRQWLLDQPMPAG